MLDGLRSQATAWDAFARGWERRRFAVLVVATGLVGGAIGAAYLGLLGLVQRVLLPERWSALGRLAVMVVVGGGVAGLVRWLGAPSDVELLVDDIHVAGGPDDVRPVRSLVPISLLCIGAGGPLGPEAPLVTTTGSVASWLGWRAGLDRERLRTLTIAGMAAGFTVLFAAPLGSAVFALEILHRRGLEYYEALLPAVVGALCGFVVSTAITGVGLVPIWHLPVPIRLHPVDLVCAVGAGLVGAAVGLAFASLAVGLRSLAGHLPVSARPVLGAVLLSAVAVISPYALTNGEAQIGRLAGVEVAAGTLLVAAAAKLVASAVAVATGWRGGFIVPLLFIGFCLGRATEGHLPGGSSWVLAASLMVAVNVAVTKTPIGSTLVVTEMAGIVLLPAVLLAAVVSLALSSPIELIETQQQRSEPPSRSGRSR